MVQSAAKGLASQALNEQHQGLCRKCISLF
jgi:hypothetical protein